MVYMVACVLLHSIYVQVFLFCIIHSGGCSDTAMYQLEKLMTKSPDKLGSLSIYCLYICFSGKYMYEIRCCVVLLGFFDSWSNYCSF